MATDGLGKRYQRALKELAGDDAAVQQNLWFASGLLLGGDYPGAAAALEIVYRIAYPDAPFPVIR